MNRAVIFDMDGLMIDSEGNQSLSFEAVLRELGEEPDYNGMGIVQTVGIRAVDNWHLLKAKHNLSLSVEKLVAMEQVHYDKLLKEGIEPMPGLVDLLAELEKHGVKRAIASSSLKENIETVLNHLGLGDYFDAVVSGHEVQHGKPAPDIFLEAARRVGVKPAEAVVLEDAAEGVLAAVSAGMKVVAVPNRYTKGHDFDKATLVVPSLELLTWKKLASLS